MHAKEIEAMARAIFDQREDDGATWACDGTREMHREEAAAALTALTTLHPGIAEYLRGDAVVVPREATPDMRQKGRNALAGWIAPAMHADDVYRAMTAASPYAKETPDAK